MYLGLDPGFSKIGFAISDGANIKQMGVIRTDNDKSATYVSEDNVSRGIEIYTSLKKIFNENKIEKLFVESMSYPRSASAAAKMSICWGIIIAICSEFNIKIIQLTPTKIKEGVTGKKYKRSEKEASKDEVEIELKRIYKDINFDILLKDYAKGYWNHAFDALGAIYVGSKL